MSLRFHRLLSSGLVLGLLLGAAPAQAAPQPAYDEASTAAAGFPVLLSAALASGDWQRVAAFFPVRNSPAFDFVKARWAHRPTGVDPRLVWGASFVPFYARGGRVGGLLRLAFQAGEGLREEQRYELELERRGRIWLVGESLPLSRSEVAVTHHDMVIDMLGGDGAIAAEAQLTLKPEGPDRRLFLRLDPGLRVTAAKLAARAWPFVQQEELIYVETPDGEGPHILNLTYAGRPSAPGSGPVRVLRAERDWYPRLAAGSPPSLFRLKATVPAGHQAVATGVLQSSGRLDKGLGYQWTTPIPVLGQSLYVAPYAHAQGIDDGIQLDAYLPRERLPAAPMLLSEAARSLTFYSTRYGRYPHAALAVIEAPSADGYGGPGALALSREVLDEPGMADSYLNLGLARNWAERLRYSGHENERGFMAEGVPTYLTMLSLAHRDGQPAFRRLLADARQRSAAAGEESLDLTGAKGALVAHMLRRHVGEAPFDKALRALYATPGDHPIGLVAFRKVFEQASGKHLEEFFRQWVTRPGVPHVTFEDLKVVPVAKGRFELVGTLVQTGAPVFLKVPLVVIGTTRHTIYEVGIRAARTAFRLKADDRPKMLLLDPLNDTMLAPMAPLVIEAGPAPGG